MSKIITICSRAAFYKHVNQLAEELENKGHKVIVPQTATKMKQAGNYDVSSYKTWYENPEEFKRKRQLMDAHFKEVENADAILVVNDEKHGQPGYIGANALMEMAIAYYLKKPIFVLNEVPKQFKTPKTINVYEEVTGMGCVILGGDIKKLGL